VLPLKDSYVKISVVIPTYNRAYILRDAIQSVLEQTYSAHEVIVVDDGSTDNTQELTKETGYEKVRYIQHAENKGCSAAYNTGINSATGDFIAFLDSDDKWKPTYLEKQVDFWNRHESIDVVFTDTEICSGSGKISSLMSLLRVFPRLMQSDPNAKELVVSGRQMYLCLLEEVPIKPSAVVVRRELFGKGGTFDEAWPSGTDWELFLRFSRFANFGFINEAIVVQRQTSDSTFLKFMEQDKQLLLKMALAEKSNLRNDAQALIAVNRGISDHYNNLAWIYLHSCRTRQSIFMYLQGFRETYEISMLKGALSALLPLGIRNSLKRLIKGSSVGSPTKSNEINLNGPTKVLDNIPP
jgi:glycosyltransferase involved in cell wall biosynthesis